MEGTILGTATPSKNEGCWTPVPKLLYSFVAPCSACVLAFAHAFADRANLHTHSTGCFTYIHANHFLNGSNLNGSCCNLSQACVNSEQ